MKTYIQILFLLTTSLLLAPVFTAEVSDSSLESIVSTNDGKTLYIADMSADCIYQFEPESGRILNVIHTPGSPTGLALTSENRSLYTTCDGENPALILYDLETRKPIKSFPLYSGACSPVIAPDKKTVWVCERFYNQVAIIDTESEACQRIPAGREPIAANLTPDGASIVIANHLPEGASNQYLGRGGVKATKLSGATVQIFNTRDCTNVAVIELMRGSTGLKDIAISPDGQYAFVTHVLAYYRLPAKQIKRGRINRNAMTIIDLNKREIFNTILLDDIDKGAANPWAIEFSDDGNILAVTHAGTHEVSLIQINKMIQHIVAMPMFGYSGYGSQALTQSAIPFDLSFIQAFRTRIILNGLGPRGIACINRRAYITCAYSAHIETVHLEDFSTDSKHLIKQSRDRDGAARLGDFYFNDASICLEGWQSCASCHPEGRMDGLNWDLLNDGEGNSKNTKSLLFSQETPPVMSTGVRPSAEIAVRAGLHHMMALEEYEAIALSIDAYLSSLRPVKKTPDEFSNDCGLIQRGENIFYSQEAQCSDCHLGEYYTDLEKYDVDSKDDFDPRWDYDTPSLIEVWRTAPYLHDGRAETLEDIFVIWNKNDFHGKTSHLSRQEIKALVAFIETL